MEKLKNQLLKLKVPLFYSNKRHFENLLLFGYKGIQRLNEIEILNEISYLEQFSEKISLVDLILERKYFGESYKLNNLLSEGHIGLINLSLEELKKLSINTDEDNKRHEVEVSSFFDIHSNLIYGNQWYLEFLIDCGFKGYFNYSPDEIKKEHFLYKDYKQKKPNEMFFINYYLDQTNELYGTNIKDTLQSLYLT